MANKPLPPKEFNEAVEKAAKAVETITGLHRQEFIGYRARADKYTAKANRWFTFALSQILDVPRRQIAELGINYMTITNHLEVIGDSQDKADIQRVKRLRELLC
jgi:hypothetical protein